MNIILALSLFLSHRHTAKLWFYLISDIIFSFSVEMDALAAEMGAGPAQ